MDPLGGIPPATDPAEIDTFEIGVLDPLRRQRIPKVGRPGDGSAGALYSMSHAAGLLTKSCGLINTSGIPVAMQVRKLLTRPMS